MIGWAWDLLTGRDLLNARIRALEERARLLRRDAQIERERAARIRAMLETSRALHAEALRKKTALAAALDQAHKQLILERRARRARMRYKTPGPYRPGGPFSVN